MSYFLLAGFCVPSPGCVGTDVASVWYSEDTALADISGVRETVLVVAAAAVDEGEISEDTGSCAVAIENRKCSNKLKRKIDFILMTCG